ncbi:MAG: hypothetical protein V1735_07505 [Nanoarchaeota archaeon]
MNREAFAILIALLLLGQALSLFPFLAVCLVLVLAFILFGKVDSSLFGAVAVALAFALVQLSMDRVLWPGLVLAFMLVALFWVQDIRLKFSVADLVGYVLTLGLLCFVFWEAKAALPLYLLAAGFLHEILFRQLILGGMEKNAVSLLLVAVLALLLRPASSYDLLLLGAEVVSGILFWKKGILASAAWMGTVFAALSFL